MDDNFQPHPGPVDDSVLYLQHEHRSNSAFAGDETTLHVRRTEYLHNEQEDLPLWMIPFLQQSGFYGFWRVGFMRLDWHLITALVERWRPETHTFHLPVGECTITLQDIQILLGLPTDGKAVTGNTLNVDFRMLCQNLLGRATTAEDWKGTRLKMSWIKGNFFPIPHHVDNLAEREQYARAFILL
jgi:hypothetical protein